MLDEARLRSLLEVSRSVVSELDLERFAALRQSVETALERIAGGIGSLRRLITDLRPATLDQLGVKTALRSLAERATEASGAHVDLRFDLEPGRGRLAPTLEETIYRLVQEALTNIAKRAAATHVQIAVVEDEDRIVVIEPNVSSAAGSSTSTVRPLSPATNSFAVARATQRRNLGRATTSRSSAISRGLVTSSTRPSTHAETVSRGGPPVEISAETRTLASRTTRARRYERRAWRSRRIACSSGSASSSASAASRGSRASTA